MKQYILFGAGEIGRCALSFLGKERVVCFCDNSPHDRNETINGVRVISADKLKDFADANTRILITTTKPQNIIDISKQLCAMDLQFSFYEDAEKEILIEESLEYGKLNKRRSLDYDESKNYLIPTDRYQEAGTISSYFWQDLWAAKLIHENRVEIHYDIGSRLDGFIAHLLSFGQKVRMVDIRPLSSKIPGLDFKMEDATNLNGIEDNSIESLSALCSLEHFGLGRYGDPIDPEACFKAFHSIQKKLKKGGNLYISVPIGKEHLEYNAHRVFSPRTIIEEFEEMELVEFSSCCKEEYEEKVSLEKYENWTEYGGDRFGLFHFLKRGNDA